jgi:hypothetical protein
MWHLTRQFWTDQRYIRVASNPDEIQFLAINHPVGVDPHTGQHIIANAIGELDVDIILDEGPDTVTLRQDVLQQVGQMASSGVPVPPAAIIELSDLPPDTKKRLLDLMQGDPQQAQMKQAADQLQLQGAAAEVDQKKAAAARDHATAMKAAAEAQGVAQGGVLGLGAPMGAPAGASPPAAPGMPPAGLASIGAPDPMAMGQQIVVEAQQAVAQAQTEQQQVEADKQALVDAIRAQMDAVKTQKAQADLALEQQAAKVQADRQALDFVKRELDLRAKEIALQERAFASQVAATDAKGKDTEAKGQELTQAFSGIQEMPNVVIDAIAPAFQEHGQRLDALTQAVVQLLAVAKAPMRVTMPDGRVIEGRKSLPAESQA